jgi:pre-mRNA cleavage complex 2 protein Pcf11
MVNVDELNRDIANLISSVQKEFATNPLDQGTQSKLKALLDLQTILQTQKLPQGQLEQVRREISKIAIAPAPKPTPPPVPTPTLSSAPINLQNALQQPAVAALLKSTNLADLLKSTTTRQQPTPPPGQPVLPFQPPVISTPPPIQASQAPAPPPVGSDLISSLRAAGLLGGPGGGLPFNLPSVQTPPIISASVTSKKIKINIPLASASLKM